MYHFIFAWYIRCIGCLLIVMNDDTNMFLFPCLVPTVDLRCIFTIVVSYTGLKRYIVNISVNIKFGQTAFLMVVDTQM